MSSIFISHRCERVLTRFVVSLIRGAFDSTTHENLPRTSYDIVIDETSNKPGEQAFEKMIAGLYLGEIFRLIMCEMIDEGVLFLGQETYKVEKPYVELTLNLYRAQY